MKRGREGREREERKREQIQWGCSKHAQGCWLLVITQTDRHSQQHEKQTGERKGGKKVCQSKTEISGLKVGWEICVLTIWNRHRHTDGTNPGRNYFKLRQNDRKKKKLNKRDLCTQFSYIAIHLIDYRKRNYKIYTTVYRKKMSLNDFDVHNVCPNMEANSVFIFYLFIF